MPADTPSQRAAVRRLLEQVLPDPAELRAFCARHFPKVRALGPDGEAGGPLVERLLSSATVAEVRYRLALEQPDAVAQHTDYALQLGEPVGCPATLRRLPWPRDPRFTGRLEQLGRLQGLLNRHGQVAITGPSGAGKTALATELAYRLIDRYALVYAVRAATWDSLLADVEALARELASQGLVELPSDAATDARCAAVRAFLNRRADWLLVVDDLRDPKALTQLLAAQAAAGHLVLTTQEAAPASMASLALGPLDEAEAMQLLALRSDRHKLLPKERAAVHRLAWALGYWPAALCSVADAVRERGGSWLAALAELPVGEADAGR